MSDVIIAEWIISLSHALKIQKLLNMKRHADSGLRIELVELDCKISDKPRDIVEKTNLYKQNPFYADYANYANYVSGAKGSAYHLKVFREIQPKE
jgi:hypothetical protein